MTENNTSDVTLNIEPSRDSRQLEVVGIRTQEVWTSENERLMEEWKMEAKDRAAKHEQTAYRMRTKNIQTGLTSILIPVVMAPVSSTFAHWEGIQYLNMSSFLLTGVLSGVNSFFAYGAQKERHFSFSARYLDLVTDIQGELVKDAKFRTNVDVFSIRVQMKLDYLNNYAPAIPRDISETEIENKK